MHKPLAGLLATLLVVMPALAAAETQMACFAPSVVELDATAFDVPAPLDVVVVLPWIGGPGFDGANCTVSDAFGQTIEGALSLEALANPEDTEQALLLWRPSEPLAEASTYDFDCTVFNQALWGSSCWEDRVESSSNIHFSFHTLEAVTSAAVLQGDFSMAVEAVALPQNECCAQGYPCAAVAYEAGVRIDWSFSPTLPAPWWYVVEIESPGQETQRLYPGFGVPPEHGLSGSFTLTEAASQYCARTRIVDLRTGDAVLGGWQCVDDTELPPLTLPEPEGFNPQLCNEYVPEAQDVLDQPEGMLFPEAISEPGGGWCSMGSPQHTASPLHLLSLAAVFACGLALLRRRW